MLKQLLFMAFSLANDSPIATLQVVDYGWWKLGRTCVVSVTSAEHKRRFTGEWYPTLMAAAMAVNEGVMGATTDVMRNVPGGTVVLEPAAWNRTRYSRREL